DLVLVPGEQFPDELKGRCDQLHNRVPHRIPDRLAETEIRRTQCPANGQRNVNLAVDIFHEVHQQSERKPDPPLDDVILACSSAPPLPTTAWTMTRLSCLEALFSPFTRTESAESSSE